MYEWRVRSDFAFSMDTINIYLGVRTPNGFALAKPIEIELGEPTDPAVAPTEPIEPFLRIPAEIAEGLLNALACQMVGTDAGNLLQVVKTLRADLARERNRVDDLIKACGMLGQIARSRLGDGEQPT